MKNWMETPHWKKECFQDQDHQFHVKAYWTEQFRISALKAPKITPKPFNPAGCYNGSEFRYPSYAEDPAAYYGD